MPKALLQGRIAVQFVDLLRQNLDESWDVLVWDPSKNSPQEFEEMAFDVDVIIGGQIPTDLWPATPNLKLFQIPWTGYDFCSPSSMPYGVPVCNCFEHESTVAEFVICGMLEMKIKMHEMDKRFREKGWDGRQAGMSQFHGEIRGRTLGIIGCGHIGVEVAKRAKAFDMRVIGLRRSLKNKIEYLDWLGTPDMLDKLLIESDFLLVGCDLNSETEGIIGESEFEKMRPESIIINVARGRVIQEEPFFKALRNKQIGGAVIDVWYNYIGPDRKEIWPTNFPFHKLENVMLSAHESASTSEQVDRRWKFVASNISEVIKGNPPQNLIFRGAFRAKAAGLHST